MKNNSSNREGDGSPDRFKDDIRHLDGLPPQISQISEISSSKEVSNSLYSKKHLPGIFGF